MVRNSDSFFKTQKKTITKNKWILFILKTMNTGWYNIDGFLHNAHYAEHSMQYPRTEQNLMDGTNNANPFT